MLPIPTKRLFANATAILLLTCSSLTFSSAAENKMNIPMFSIVSMCTALHTQITKDQFKPDLLIGLARGGLIPLGFLAGEPNFNNRNTRTINLESYSDEGKKSNLRLTCAMRAEDFPGSSLLVIDDLTDSGDSLAFVMSKLKELRPEAQIKTAVLFYKAHSKIKPDYYVEMTDKWVVFPWEV